jgi:hypothetical protein
MNEITACICYFVNFTGRRVKILYVNEVLVDNVVPGLKFSLVSKYGFISR